MYKIYFAFFIGAVVFWSCAKNENSKPAADITIISLTASVNPVKAWDTTVITMEAVGDSLQYRWEANHGKLKGSGKTVKYSACQSCIGLNTITCRVFNQTGEVSDTIMIRVKSYYPHVK